MESESTSKQATAQHDRLPGGAGMPEGWADERISLTDQERKILRVVEPTLTALGYVAVHIEVIGGTRGGRTVRFYIDYLDGKAPVFEPEASGDEGDDDGDAAIEPATGPGGERYVTIADCVRASRQMDLVLDVEEVITGSYQLEVSSPGLDRPLGRRGDFVRFEGKAAKIETDAPIQGRRRWSGTLRGVDQSDVKIEVDGVIHAVPFDRIRKAHIRYDFDQEATATR